MNRGTKIYRSRISPLIYGFVWSIVVFVFYLTIRAALNDSTPMSIGIIIIIWIPIVTFLLYIMLGIRYLIDGNYLTIKIGQFTERKIFINEIWFLERSYNPLGSPANSLRRLRINYRYGQVMISPAKEKDFIRLLKLINPKIKIINLKM